MGPDHHSARPRALHQDQSRAARQAAQILSESSRRRPPVAVPVTPAVLGADLEGPLGADHRAVCPVPARRPGAIPGPLFLKKIWISHSC